MGDFGEMLSDEAVRALELLDEPEAPPQCCMISAHALSGTEASATIRLPVTVGDKVMLLLLDSGSSHSFINANFAQSIGAHTLSIPPVPVKVANGQCIPCDSLVPQLEWHCQGSVFHTDLRVLDLGAYDGVLGMDWLASFSPMSCDWQGKAISFAHKGKTVILQGITSDTLAPPTQMDFSALLQLQATNAIWSMAVVEVVPPTAISSDLPVAISRVLSEFADVFEEPSGYLLIASTTMRFHWKLGYNHQTLSHTDTRQFKRMRLNVRYKRC
uniref:Uncharacterized protein n=1 Tax=Avena sativa TaxID=4498 RepID=A0ACD6AU41_AVESA